MKTKLNLLYFFIIANFWTVGQVVGQVVIGSDVDSGDPSAVLHLKSGSTVNEAGGFILPKLDGLYTDSWLDSKGDIRYKYNGLLVQNVETNFTSIYKFEASLTPKWQILDPWDVVHNNTNSTISYLFQKDRLSPPGVNLQINQTAIDLNGANLTAQNIQVQNNVNVNNEISASKITNGTLGAVPVGGIIMWTGTTAPDGWVLCNGENESPDLRGRFIVGYGENDDNTIHDPVYNKLNETGGAKSVALTKDEMPSHNHTIDQGGIHKHGITWPKNQGDKHLDAGKPARLVESNDDGQSVASDAVPQETDESGSHTHNINSTGGGKAHENRPPFYVLAFIMYTGVDQNP